jgi:integrase
MASIKKEIIKRITEDIISETELENIMSEYGYVPIISDDAENILKFTNYKCQLWIDVERDNDNNLICENVRQVTKEKGEETKKEPIRSFADLIAIEQYFYDNKQYDYWLIGWLMASLGRRVGDTVSLKWSDLYKYNGTFRERLSTLKEEKTGKTIGVLLSNFAKNRVEEFCKLKGIDPIKNYNNKVFSKGDAAFRNNLELAVNATGLEYPIGTHSFRKFFGTTLMKLHPNDPNAIKMIQYIFGHSSEEMTKLYIGTIDERKDCYLGDLSNYLDKSYRGESYEVDNSPVITLRTQDIRRLVSNIYFKGKNNFNSQDDISIINDLISTVETARVM